MCLTADVGDVEAEREFKRPIDCLTEVYKSDGIKASTEALMSLSRELSSSELPTLVSMIPQRECSQIPKYLHQLDDCTICPWYCCHDFPSFWQSSLSLDMHTGALGFWRKTAHGWCLQGEWSSALMGVGGTSCLSCMMKSRGSHSIASVSQNPVNGHVVLHSIFWTFWRYSLGLFVLLMGTAPCWKAGGNSSYLSSFLLNPFPWWWPQWDSITFLFQSLLIKNIKGIKISFKKSKEKEKNERSHRFLEFSICNETQSYAG